MAASAAWWWPVLEGLGRLFYIVDPRTTTFERVEDVPDYITEAIPFFVSSIILEAVIGFFVKGHRRTRINDGVTSLAQGLFMQLSHKFLLRTFQLSAYIWCYKRFHLVDLDVHNIWTWILGFLAVDLGYYTFHRYGHEINIFWAAHIVRCTLERRTTRRYGRRSNLVSGSGSFRRHVLARPLRYITAQRTTTRRRPCGRASCRRTRRLSFTCRPRSSCHRPCLPCTTTLACVAGVPTC